MKIGVFRDECRVVSYSADPVFCKDLREVPDSVIAEYDEAEKRYLAACDKLEDAFNAVADVEAV